VVDQRRRPAQRLSGQRRAFTLIELAAVITLLALLAGATAWALAGDVQRGRRIDVIAQLRHADRMARLTALRTGHPQCLRFDLKEQRVWRTRDEPRSRGTAGHPYDLPDNFRIQRIVMLETPDKVGYQADAEIDTLDHGQANIPVAASGRSVSYALRLAAAHHPATNDESDATDAPPRWLVLSGLTGQVTLHHDEEAIDNLFELLAEGADAD
jgi:prepilin-type N-terminal cleavage/methylation domain-containing protein